MNWYESAVKRVMESKGQVVELKGCFNFKGQECDFDQGFKGLVLKSGNCIEGVVVDLYKHPTGISNKRYIIGRMSHSELEFVKLPPQGNLEVYHYKTLVNGVKNNFEGIFGRGRFEFITGEWCTSQFAETIRFDFEYGKNSCKIIVDEVLDGLNLESVKKDCIDFLEIYKNGKDFDKYLKFLNDGVPEELWHKPDM